MANPQHVKLASSGPDALDSWRENNPETQLDLEAADLTGVNLAGTKIRDANLKGANLTSARLSRANLAGANLSGANLTDCDLGQAGSNNLQAGRATPETSRHGTPPQCRCSWGQNIPRHQTNIRFENFAQPRQ